MVGVVATVLGEQAHLEVVGHGSNAVHSLGGLLGIALLAEAADGAA